MQVQGCLSAPSSTGRQSRAGRPGRNARAFAEAAKVRGQGTVWPASARLGSGDPGLGGSSLHGQGLRPRSARSRPAWPGAAWRCRHRRRLVPLLLRPEASLHRPTPQLRFLVSREGEVAWSCAQWPRAILPLWVATRGLSSLPVLTSESRGLKPAAQAEEGPRPAGSATLGKELSAFIINPRC